MKNTIYRMRLFLIVFILSIAPILIYAQGGFDDNVNDNPVPFDGGVSLLVAAGVGYGLKKAHERKKAQKELNEIK